jgi:hypothetical protein
MLWKIRWTGDWFLRKAADQPNRARIQDNQILISASDEFLSQTLGYYCLMTGELPVPPPEFPLGIMCPGAPKPLHPCS